MVVACKLALLGAQFTLVGVQAVRSVSVMNAMSTMSGGVAVMRPG